MSARAHTGREMLTTMSAGVGLACRSMRTTLTIALLVSVSGAFAADAVSGAEASARAPSPVHFEKRVLTGQYYCDGINAGDFDRDGHMDIVAGPYWYTASGPWQRFYHGEGTGDINGDGRPDVVLNDGWWEQPRREESERSWLAHPFRFSNDRGGAQILVYDVDGDGDNDVITALNAHGWGLAWLEQVREGGRITFREHKIMGDRSEEAKYGVAFSQPHALALGDLDGDGLQDVIVGKRLWAHGPQGDVEPDAPPVLYWFQLVRGPNQSVNYVPHLVDDHSGVGSQVTVMDVNGDGRPEILTVSKLGSFVFLNRPDRSGPSFRPPAP